MTLFRFFSSKNFCLGGGGVGWESVRKVIKL